jgi:hypothetical protein
VTQTRAFDTEPASSSYASGFIVDKARGILLTNRHVVTPGACGRVGACVVQAAVCLCVCAGRTRKWQLLADSHAAAQRARQEQ